MLGKRWRILAWGGAAVLLLLPLIAMQLTDEVVWSGSDFATFGAMLLLALGAFELTVRLTAKPTTRALAFLAIGAVFVLTWINLAVGIFGPG